MARFCIKIYAFIFLEALTAFRFWIRFYGAEHKILAELLNKRIRHEHSNYLCICFYVLSNSLSDDEQQTTNLLLYVLIARKIAYFSELATNLLTSFGLPSKLLNCLFESEPWNFLLSPASEILHVKVAKQLCNWIILHEEWWKFLCCGWRHSNRHNLPFSSLFESL